MLFFLEFRIYRSQDYPKLVKRASLSPIYRTPVLMVGSVICQKPEEVMTVRIPSRCSERIECSRAHSGVARKGITAKVQTLGLNLITFAT